MDDHYRMRLKVGAHEFEAEGPVAVVQEQVKRFMDLIASMPTESLTYPHTEKPTSDASPQVAITKVDAPIDEPALGKIMRITSRVVSLTVRPKSADDAVLLLLYGQKVMRENDSVTGSELISGLTTTGGLSAVRIDRLLEKLARDGDVIVIGERRAKRYRLTNTGFAKARQLATDMVAIVA